MKPSLKIFDYKLDKKHWPVLKPFLIFLKFISNDEYTNTPMDPSVVEQLRKI